MSDRFYTFMLVPEKSGRVRKITLPAIYVKSLGLLALIIVIVGFFLIFDYFHVLSQVAENKKLRLENHLIKMDVQKAKTKLETLDQNMNRLKAFSQKLRLLGNLDQPGVSRILQTPSDVGTSGGTDGEEDGGSIEDIGGGGKSQTPNPKAPAKNKKTNTPSNQSSQSTIGPETIPSQMDNIHNKLEYDRSLSLTGEFGEAFNTATLIEQIGTITKAAEKLNGRVQNEEKNFALLYEELRDSVDRLLHTPSIMPALGWITSHFGYRTNPFVGTKTFHAGIDIANRPGTPVHSPANGVVTFAGYHGGFGLVVQIDHGFGLKTKYGHNSRAIAKVGDRVIRGEKIAEIGSSGRSTGPHLHYQVEVHGKPVNPMLFILEDTF